jgi:hypothetical protein
MPMQFPAEFRQLALRLLAEARQQDQYETEWAAITAVASRLEVNSERCGSGCGVPRWMPARVPGRHRRSWRKFVG